ncbi:MAG: hypothetical protein ACLTBX_01435 [Clostridia bacterium]
MFKRKYLEKAIEIKTSEIFKLENELKNAKHNNVILIKENLTIKEENKDLRFENEEQLDLIKRIDESVNSNKYNNEKAVLNKIKELVRDYQSIN